jgi:hypothetical protein
MSESTDDVSEVSYKDSVTELFLAIEEMEWRDAFDIIASDPKQIRTWVNNNSGAESTTFNYWRRLPIHEVRSSTVVQDTTFDLPRIFFPRQQCFLKCLPSLTNANVSK